jgi:DNA-binding response OmpR family regulator
MTNRKRVLLAEDSEMLRQLYTDFLKGEGIDVVAVGDGLDAFNAFLTHGPFDAVVTDCDLTGLSGMQLVARLRDQHTAVPVLFMSGQMALDDAEQERLQVGPPLRKPFTLESLLQAIRRLLGGRSG